MKYILHKIIVIILFLTSLYIDVDLVENVSNFVGDLVFDLEYGLRGQGLKAGMRVYKADLDDTRTHLWCGGRAVRVTQVCQLLLLLSSTLTYK